MLRATLVTCFQGTFVFQLCLLSWSGMLLHGALAVFRHPCMQMLDILVYPCKPFHLGLVGTL